MSALGGGRMFSFPDSLYCDVRIEEVFQTQIAFVFGNVQEMLERRYEAAFIRVFDGKRWYYSATSAIDTIQEHINRLASIATPSRQVVEHPVIQKLEAHRETLLLFSGSESVSSKSIREKYDLLSHYFPIIENYEYIRFWMAHYVDELRKKHFVSSKGADLTFDYQKIGIHFGYEMNLNDNQVKDSFSYGTHAYRKIETQDRKFANTLNRSVDFLKRAKNIESGRYPVILSPIAAGIFAHESFGHLSESDTYQGDQALKERWVIGKQVAHKNLSIVDDGNVPGMGYTPFDDEGTKARKTYLIRDGVMVGRLHNAATAVDFNENLTGNARASSFEYEPIVRMTNTYIESGKKPLCLLIGEVDNGFLIETIGSGFGSTNFTISPVIAYRIRKGTIAEPVKISLLAGNAFETLFKIDGISDEAILSENPFISCTKRDQSMLPIDFGGPYVRLSEIDVVG